MTPKAIVESIRTKGYVLQKNAGNWGALIYKKNPHLLHKAVIKAFNNRTYVAYVAPHFLGTIVEILD